MRRSLALFVVLAVHAAVLAPAYGLQGGGPEVLGDFDRQIGCNDVFVAGNAVYGCRPQLSKVEEVDGEFEFVPLEYDEFDFLAQAVVRSTVAHVGGGDFKLIDLAAAPLTVDAVPYSEGAPVNGTLSVAGGRNSFGRERFVAPVAGPAGIGVGVEVLTNEPVGPGGPDGPTGGWTTQYIAVDPGVAPFNPAAADRLSVAVLKEFVFVGSGQTLVRINTLSGAQDVVWSDPVSSRNFVLLPDDVNDRLFLSFLIFGEVVGFLGLSVLPAGADAPIEVTGLPPDIGGFDVVRRSASSSLGFVLQPSGQVSSVEVGPGGVASIAPFAQVEESFVGLEFLVKISGDGDRLVVPVSGFSNARRIYDISGYVHVPNEALPPPTQVNGVEGTHVAYLANLGSEHPHCAVNVDSGQGWCFELSADREAYIDNGLLGNPGYGTIWIGRFDEEVVAP